MQAAADLLERLDIDQDAPIDVFAIIDNLDLWLVFGPLESLLGVMLPDGGMMLTTERPPTIQRYTAAHEIAHWVLDHNRAAFDTEADVLGAGRGERERLAQLFASYLLMPPSLVHTAAARYQVRSGTTPKPVQAYLMARDMRVSYEAGLRQMNNLNMITGHERDRLLEVAPLDIKKQLAHGHRPRDGRADIWPVDATSMYHAVDLTVDDEIIVTLPENRTTGYRWLDEAANERRTHHRGRPAPPAFAPPPLVPLDSASATPDGRRTAADVTAALSLLPRAAATAPEKRPADQDPDFHEDDDLVVVFDHHQADAGDLSTSDVARLRRARAGAVSGPAATDDSPDELALEDEIAQPVDLSTPRIGASGRRWLSLWARTEGHFTYLLHYAAPHDPVSRPAATFTVEATVEPAPAVANRRRLLEILGGEDNNPTGDTEPDTRNEPDR